MNRELRNRATQIGSTDFCKGAKAIQRRKDSLFTDYCYTKLVRKSQAKNTENWISKEGR